MLLFILYTLCLYILHVTSAWQAISRYQMKWISCLFGVFWYTQIAKYIMSWRIHYIFWNIYDREIITLSACSVYFPLFLAFQLTFSFNSKCSKELNTTLGRILKKQESRGTPRSHDYQKLYTYFLSGGLIFAYQQAHHRIS